MVDETLAEKLERDYEETKAHIEDGNQRIKAYYSDDHEPPADYPTLDKPPHQSLIEEAAKLIEYASGDLIDHTQRLSDPEKNAELILYGVGLERLVAAVHLKLESESFIEHLDKTGKTPWFGDSWDIVEGDLSTKLAEEQVDIVRMTKKIVWEHRNNEAHLGYHRHRSFQLTAILLDVTATLLQHYSEEHFGTLDTLLARAEELSREDRWMPWDGEFDPNGRL